MSNPPIYQRIKSTILTNIHSGIWVAGQAIPTEISLAEQFGVSRMTVNRALKELTDEKVLERRQGSGTFVAQKKFDQTFVTIHNVREDIEGAGKHYHAKCVFNKSVRHKDLSEFAKSIFLPKQDLHEVHVIHYGDGVPLQIEKRIVNVGLVPDFVRQDFGTVNISDFLIRRVPLVHGNYKIFATPCPADIADLLGVRPDEAVLLIRRHTYSLNQTAVTLVEMWHRGDSFMFEGAL